MKTISTIAASIAALLFVGFWIYASIEDKEHYIFIFFAAVFAVFLTYGFIITKIDDKKKAKKGPPDFHDEKMGDFWRDKFGRLTREIEWLHEKDIITQEAVGDTEEEVLKAVTFGHLLFKDPNETDKLIRRFVTDELLSLANDWNDDGIDESHFYNVLTLTSIKTSHNGDYEFWLDADGIFTDHTIIVYGNAQSGFERAEIEG
ncbi:MAG: DUF2262 domain-containing protein [Oscillospiraceae bacterium]|nr:DUF2262 domain-containing protein [Oscillospiraceae bacterium]